MTKRTRWILGLAAVFIGLPLLLVWNSHRLAAAAIERHDRDLKILVEKFRARARARPSAFGEPQAGDAAPFYKRASAMLDAMPEEERRDIPEMDHSTFTPEDAKIAGILEKYAPAVELLREALRRSPSGAEILEEWRWSGDKPMASAQDFILGVAAHHRRAGRSAAALESLFLLLGILQDHSWEWGYLSTLRKAEEESRSVIGEILGNHSLTGAELDRLLDVWDRLEKSRPTLQDELDLEDFRMRRLIRDPAKDEMMAGPYRIGHYRPIQPSWRTLWSREIARAKSLTEIEDHFRRRREMASRPWHERWPAVRAYMETQVGRFVDPPSGHGLQLEGAEDYETYAAEAQTLIRAALEVARYEVLQGRFPSEPPGAPRSPHSGLPFVVEDGTVQDPTPIFGRSIKIQRRP